MICLIFAMNLFQVLSSVSVSSNLKALYKSVIIISSSSSIIIIIIFIRTKCTNMYEATSGYLHFSVSVNYNNKIVVDNSHNRMELCICLCAHNTLRAFIGLNITL